MIELKIPEPKKNKKYYSIFLGENLKFEFSNLKKAKKFKVEIETLLNDCLDSINNSYSQVHSLYRQQYLFIDSSFERRELKETVINIEEQFATITMQMYSKSENGAYFIYNKLINVFATVKNLLRQLSSISTQKKHTSITKVCFSLMRHILTELEFLTELKESLFNNQTIKSINYELRIVA